MRDIMGLIYTGENDQRLRELTLSRAVAALPVIGRYRVIDFPMSSLVNAGARNVGVITQRNYHSLMDHLGSGREWDLHGKNDGLFILPPFLTRENVGVYAGMLDALRSNMGYLRRSSQEYVVLTDSHVVYNVDFAEMLRYHIDMQADISVLCGPVTPKLPGVSEYRVYLDLDQDSRVTGLSIDPSVTDLLWESLSVVLMRRELLIDIVSKTAGQGQHSFTRDVMQRVVQEKRLKVSGYPSPARGWHIDSVQSYFQLHMDTLKADVRAMLFDARRPVYTKVRDDMPARYGEGAQVSGSLVADGTSLNGTVENSVIFRGVTIAPGAVVRNSIIMQDAEVQEGAELDHCILDKQAVVKKNGRLIGPASYPIVISKNVTI
ncbi:MAG: glucose-1-phosphate adenylyltransferase subunit GlgD [Oscillospiraceae bacterium]|jgi:glucose-1-phosphate adenylyltransferase|nr:glucose-1-phosphate adenylyltransferase subunit GlgD [Oscillospiraceae bacterium]